MDPPVTSDATGRFTGFVDNGRCPLTQPVRKCFLESSQCFTCIAMWAYAAAVQAVQMQLPHSLDLESRYQAFIQHSQARYHDTAPAVVALSAMYVQFARTRYTLQQS
jgi:hypothetical protein